MRDDSATPRHQQASWVNEKYELPILGEYDGVEKGHEDSAPRAHWHLYLAAVAANMCTVNAGCMMGWTSPARRFLVDEKMDPGPIDKETWTLIVSVFLLGSAVGPLPQGFLADKFGRKPCLLGIGVVSIISWVLITAANGATMILIARFLAGMAVGALLSMLAMYIAEISTDDVRSTLASAMQFSATLGYLVSYSVGPYVKPYVLGIVSGALPTLFLALFLFTPETPYFLVGKGDMEGATKALAWFRGQPASSKGVKKEISSIQVTIQEAGAERAPLWTKLRGILGKRENLKAFSICSGLLFLAQLTGIVPVLFFAESIFKATGSSLDPAVCTIVIGVVQMIASMGTLALTRFFSMKALMVMSAVGMATGHGILGYYFHVKRQGGDILSLGVLPLVALVLYIAFYCFGFGPLPWATMGEMFGSDVKATASAIATALCCIVGFVVTWKFEALLDAVGEPWTFWTFGLCCAVASIYTAWLVPNTRGKSLHEIQNELRGRRTT